MEKLMKKSDFQIKLYLVAAILGLLLVSCANQRQIIPSCTLPAGVNLDEAFEHSREDLGHLECEVLFDSYYERLIEVAKRDPDMSNKRKFSDFLEWANTAGIIDKIQARSYYNRYFNRTFMSLPDEYNVCSSCSEKKQRDLSNSGWKKSSVRRKKDCCGPVRTRMPITWRRINIIRSCCCWMRPARHVGIKIED